MALAGNIIVLSLTVLLLASGWPILLVMVPAGIAVSYITLVKQNGKNVKAGAAFLAAGIVMGLLFPAVLLVVTQAGIGGLNEIQAQQEDVMLYYNVNISIRMVQLAVGVNLLSILGAVLDTTLSVTSSMYEVMLHKPEITRAELVWLWDTDRKGDNRHDRQYASLRLSGRVHPPVFLCDKDELFL